jgi:hypothetical protein
MELLLFYTYSFPSGDAYPPACLRRNFYVVYMPSAGAAFRDKDVSAEYNRMKEGQREIVATD